MKRWILLQFLTVILVAAFGLICRAQFSDIGLLDIKSLEDVSALDYGISFIFGDNPMIGDTEEDLYNNLITYENDYIKDMDLAPIIVVGHATGNIVNYRDSLGQEIVVDRIIRGHNITERESYYVYCVDCFELNQNGRIVYSGLKNLMNTKDNYLIFLEPSALNNCTEKKVFTLCGAFFNYLNLSEYSRNPIMVPIDEVTGSDLKDVEFFAGSQRMVDELNFIKSKIICNYIKEFDFF